MQRMTKTELRDIIVIKVDFLIKKMSGCTFQGVLHASKSGNLHFSPIHSTQPFIGLSLFLGQSKAKTTT